MVERQLILSGLLRQRHLLSEIIGALEGKPSSDLDENDFLIARSLEISRNLRKLRKLKNEYFRYQLQ